MKLTEYPKAGSKPINIKNAAVYMGKFMPKFCRECGTAVNEEDKFCPKCGYNLRAPVEGEKSPPTIPTKPIQKKSLATAAILNFFLWGIGYVYLGKWWGILIFVLDLLVMGGILIEGKTYDLTLNIVGVAISTALSWHAYKLAEEINLEKE